MNRHSPDSGADEGHRLAFGPGAQRGSPITMPWVAKAGDCLPCGVGIRRFAFIETHLSHLDQRVSTPKPRHAGAPEGLQSGRHPIRLRASSACNPTQPIPTGIASGRYGADSAVPDAEAQQPVSDSESGPLRPMIDDGDF